MIVILIIDFSHFRETVVHTSKYLLHSTQKEEKYFHMTNCFQTSADI